MFFILKLVIIVLILALVAAGARTWQIEHSDNQKRFMAGTAPTPPPDGLYKGSVAGYHGSWQGKKFDAANKTGINIFSAGTGSTTIEKYPFATTIGKGARDYNLTVMKIDYNLESNPWWLRPTLDEIVQISPDSYLGKLHIRLIPSYPFTLGFFELRK